MSDLKFTDTHNLVAFLSKPAESENCQWGSIVQALVDGKKIVITESIVRRDLQLEDAEGTDCLPNATIFEKLTLIGFVQVFLDQQVGDMSNHKRIYVTPSHTKNIFGNMKREGKGFSGRVTPLFPTMMVQAQKKWVKKHKPRKPKRKNTEVPQPSGPATNVADEVVNKENVSKHSNDQLLSGEDSLKLEELMALCTTLQQRVLALV
ncbi:hypothetical protein Tco_1293049 [Tanacetum coccineum]